MLKHLTLRQTAMFMLIIVLLMGGGLSVSIIYLTQETKSVENAWLSFQAERSEKARLKNSLHSILGYGGMIHEFKNYVLRKEKARKKKIHALLGAADVILAQYRLLSLNDIEAAALRDIQETLDNYSEAIVVIEAGIQAGLLSKEIDAPARVDDSLAFHGLAVLRNENIHHRQLYTESVGKAVLAGDLRAKLGYGGVIHAVKNYVLRQEDEYLEHAQADLDVASNIINSYRGLDVSVTEEAALQSIESIISLYGEGLKQTQMMIAEHKSPEEIDLLVRVDDSNALEGLSLIDSEINKQIEEKSKGVLGAFKVMLGTSQLMLIWVLVSTGLIIMLSVWVLITKIANPIKRMSVAMFELAGGNTGVGVEGAEQKNEIGGMAKAIEVFRENIIKREHAERDMVRFKTTLDETLDGVFMFDPDSFKFFYVNRGAIEHIGYSYDELLTMAPYDIAPDYDEESFRQFVSPLIEGESKSTSFETANQHKDGHIISVEIFLQYVDPPNELPRFVAIVRDITERKRVDKLKNEFISTVSHELRTPLTSIRGSLGLIVGGAVGELPAQAHEMLKIASNNTERLLILINDILDIQKIESGMMAFRFEDIDLVELLQDALRDYAGYAEQYGVRFVIANDPGDARVFADRPRLMQVLANLLSNAAKFAPENSEIEISVTRQEGALRVSVSDSGSGIPDDFLPKLFDKFTQLDSSDTRQKGGTGLGLPISKAIIEKHGGKIDVVSKLGSGSTFYFELPELLAQISLDNDYLSSVLADKQLASVLIVEDDVDIATLIQHMITQTGHRADIAHDVAQARRLLAQNQQQYKLMTLDMMLPDESGIGFLRSLRQDPMTRDLPVVVVSGNADEVRHDLPGGAMGVVDWLSKPIDQARLVKVVKQIAVPDRLPKVLHVEDEVDVHEVVNALLQQHCELVWASTLAASQEALASHDFDLVLLDIGLPDGSGLDLLTAIKRYVKPPRVVIFSAHDVSQEYADKVNAVLVKSKTSNQELLDTLTSAIKGS